MPDWFDANAPAAERAKKGGEAVQLITLTQGSCLQALLIGRYADEAPVLAELQVKLMSGARVTFGGHHHEVYLSDPRKVPPWEAQHLPAPAGCPIETALVPGRRADRSPDSRKYAWPDCDLSRNGTVFSSHHIAPCGATLTCSPFPLVRRRIVTKFTRRQVLASTALLPLAAAAPAQAATYSVSIQGFAYDPASFKVAAGDTIIFINKDSAPHTATAEDGSFDTGQIAPGQSVSVTIPAGTHPYYCTIHPMMKGVATAT